MWLYHGVCGEFGLVGFLVVCFQHKINPNPISIQYKIICCGEKVAPKMPLFNLFIIFLGLVWPWVIGEFVGFMIMTIMCSNPTELGKIAKHPWPNSSGIAVVICGYFTVWVLPLFCSPRIKSGVAVLMALLRSLTQRCLTGAWRGVVSFELVACSPDAFWTKGREKSLLLAGVIRLPGMIKGKLATLIITPYRGEEIP